MRMDVESQLHELNGTLSDIYKKLPGGLKPLMTDIGAVVESSTRERFSTKKDPDGIGWQQLSPERLEQKKGRGGILVDYGDLMKSITSHATAVSVEVGTDRPYGKYHQMGWGVPERKFLGLSDDDFADIRELLNDYLEDIIDG